MHDQARHRLLGSWGSLITRYPVWTLIVSLSIAACSIVFAITSLSIKTDRNDLISADLPWAKRYATYRHDFPHWNDLVICLEGSGDEPRIDTAARELATHLRGTPFIKAAEAGFYGDQVGPRLWRVAPKTEFEHTLDELARGRAITAAPTPAAALVTMLRQGDTGTEPDAAALRSALTPYMDAIAGRPVHFDLSGQRAKQWQPFTTSTGRIRTVLVALTAPTEGSIAGIADSLAALRNAAAEWMRANGHDDIAWGVTGIPAIESDETAQAAKDSTISSIVAFILITAMLIGVFRRVRLPLMAASALVIGIAWSFGWVVVSVGHLQLLSMVFSAILIGLGVDFALHIVTRLRVIEPECATLPEAMQRTFRDVGPGLITGAVTTAAAFGCTAFSAFLGVAEMGIIAAGGVLLCLLAVMSVFPALLALSRRWRNDLAVMRPVGTGTLNRLAGPLHNHAWLVLLLGGLVTAGLVAASTRLGYDSNIMNLQPSGLEAVSWQRRLAAEPGGDLWSGLVMATPDEAPRLTAELDALSGVESVGGMGMLFPPDLESRQNAVATVRETAPIVHAGSDQLGFVATVLGTLRDRLRAIEGTGMRVLVADLDEAVKSWVTLDRNTTERRARMQLLTDAWSEDAPPAAATIKAALAPSPPGPSDLPGVLRSQWVGDQGQWLLRVTPRVSDESILNPARLGAFVSSIRTVAPNVLGPPVQILESSKLIVRAYTTSGLLAMAAVLLILLIDFRSIADALSAMLPVLVGFAGTFGFMGIVGLDLNFANLMVLPMIFGIGVDAGVHVIHRWRSDPFMRPPGLWGGTGSGILLTTATTMIGFGSLMLAEHRGIRSLAIVMVVGLLITLIAAWTILPAVLRLRQQQHGDVMTASTDPH
ncbi:MAG: MMPL family transporter [Phycisphaerales bacterium]|nr:MMPL family transporter [Phycisphaerales bacterium]